jgi:hypothetical protein
MTASSPRLQRRAALDVVLAGTTPGDRELIAAILTAESVPPLKCWSVPHRPHSDVVRP